MGELLAFLMMVCRAVLVLEEGVMDGTQNDGRVVLEALNNVKMKSHALGGGEYLLSHHQ
jgi:hypothetical protein